MDVVGIFAGYQHIGFADGVGLRVEFLTDQPDIGVRIDPIAEVVLANRQHAAGAAAGVKMLRITPCPPASSRCSANSRETSNLTTSRGV